MPYLLLWTRINFVGEGEHTESYEDMPLERGAPHFEGGDALQHNLAMLPLTMGVKNE